MKKLLLAALLALSACAHQPKYLFTEGPLRVEKFQHPSIVFVEEHFDVTLLLAGTLPTEPVLLSVYVNDEPVANTTSEGLNKRIIRLTGISAPLYLYLALKGYHHPLDLVHEYVEPEALIPPIDWTGDEEPHVEVKVEIRELVWKDGRYQPGPRLTEVHRTIRFDCRYCTV